MFTTSFDSLSYKEIFLTKYGFVCSGLLSAHVLASELQAGGDFLSWYRGELLTLAHDLGRRLLPAFNTSTGIPHSRVRFALFDLHIFHCCILYNYIFINTIGKFETRASRTTKLKRDMHSLRWNYDLRNGGPFASHWRNHI